MDEASFQSMFTKWCRANATESMACELKICHGKSMPFTQVAPHQYQALSDAKAGRLVHKLSDSAIGFLPFDMFALVGSAAYVVVLFYQPRQPKEVIFIDIDVLLTERETSDRKSLTKERAMQIASKVITL